MVKGWKCVTRVWDVGLQDFWDAITLYKVKISSITLEKSILGGGDYVIVMNTCRIQDLHFSVNYSRCWTFLDLDVSNLDKTPTRRVEVHDVEPILNPSIEQD